LFSTIEKPFFRRASRHRGRRHRHHGRLAAGGIFGESYASCGRVANVIPVDCVVRGCPPAPAGGLHGPESGARTESPRSAGESEREISEARRGRFDRGERALTSSREAALSRFSASLLHENERGLCVLVDVCAAGRPRVRRLAVGKNARAPPAARGTALAPSL
jgi:hypothetical protein